LFTSAGDAGFKICEVPLTGIFSYKAKGRFMDEIVIADPQTVRVLAEIQVASADVEVSPDAIRLIQAGSQDQNGNFVIDDIFDIDDIFNNNFSFDNEAQSTTLFDGTLEDFLQSEKPKETDDAYTISQNDFSLGVWNFILVRLENGVNKNSMLKQIDNAVSDYGASAYNWRIAAGTSAILVLLLQMLFNAGVMLVSIAGIIAIINIFLISVFKRTREIGTLRALGAGDSYIRILVISENIFFAIAASITGIVFGLLVLTFINKLQLHINNDLLANLFGGAVLHIGFVPGVAYASVLLSFLLSIAASIYPTEMAVKIAPVVAVRQG
jgi:ABC-type antimicrobial peptide transport system permease subunit